MRRNERQSGRSRPARTRSRRAPVGLFGLQIRMARVRCRDQGAQRIEVGRPARLVFVRALAERPLTDLGLQRPAQAAHLHVVRHHHDELVRWLDQVHQRDEVRLGAAVGDLHVRRRGARIHRRDRRAQLGRAVRLGISERQRHHRLAVAFARRRAPRREAGGRRSRRDSRPLCVPRSTGAARARRPRSSCRKSVLHRRRPCGVQLGYPFAPHGFDG